VGLLADLQKLGTTFILAPHDVPLLDSFDFPRMILSEGKVAIDG
jgi:cell division transport system ATP-binding protein